MKSKVVWFGVGFLVLASAVIIFVLNSNPKTSEEVPLPTPTITSSPSGGDGSEEKVREIEIVAKEYSFLQSEITVKKGEKIKLTLVNEGTMEHDFVVERMNITTEPVSPGSSVSTEFTMFDSGTYTFYCGIKNHRARGMEGKLIVI